MIESFEQYILERLVGPLPGETAHEEVAPYRKVYFDDSKKSMARQSAVLILFYQKQDSLHTVLIQRPTYKGKHSGQIAFPGGKVEEEDVDHHHTALRESNEEIGLQADRVKIIGELSEVYIPVSNFIVRPVLATTPVVPEFIIDPREVDHVLEIPVQQILDHNHLPIQKVRLSNEMKIKVPTFSLMENTVWGATAMMLNEFRHIMSDFRI